MWERTIHWRREWPPTPVFSPGQPHGQRILVSYSPWGRKNLDTTERLALSVFMVWRKVSGVLQLTHTSSGNLIVNLSGVWKSRCQDDFTLVVIVLQSLSHVRLCNAMDCSTPGFPVLHHLPDPTQTHVHWVGEAIQLSHPLSSPFLPTFNLSQHQGLFWGVSSLHQVAKVLELQLQHQSFQWIFRVDFL